MAGRFVVVRDGDDGYRFRIEAEDGQLMATSKSSALKGVEAIKRNAAHHAQVDDQSGDDQAPRPRPGWPAQMPSCGCQAGCRE